MNVAVLYLDELPGDYSDFSESNDSDSNFEPEMNSSDKECEEEVESPTQGKNLLTNLQSKPTLVSDENAEKRYLNSVQDVPRQPKITQDDSSSSQVDFDSYDTTLPVYNKIL